MWIAEPEKEFTTKNGYKLYTLSDLLLWLNFCTDDEFKFHVNGVKNDLAKWIKDVFKLEHLADKVSKAKTREEMIRIIAEFVNSASKVERKGEEQVLGEFLHEIKHGV